MEKSLRTLAQISARGRAVAVLGDMLELGDSTHFFHQQLGVLITKLNLSAVFLMGSHANVVAESARSHGMNQDIIHSSTNHQQVARHLDQYAKANDVILFKGSRGMQIEKCLEQFLLLRNTGSSGSTTTKTVQAGYTC
jgi:UDP-N-acetylmuramyl pentapeptide synthase